MQWYKALVISQTLLHGLNLNKIPNFLFRFYFIVHEYFALFVRNCTSTKSCQCECVDYGFYEICKEAIMCFCLDLRLVNIWICFFMSKQIKLDRVYLLYAYFCVLRCLVALMHEYICMMASISQTADRLWPDMTAWRLVTWQPTMLVSTRK